ncbi:MAG: aromatic ring-hydroxylating dioxygenase subunit alpha, partial [Okeania sp. SIO3B5]|uniref:aromatic ring-hydroxylating dioxygenase subunit alpha n=1 Tax=Okeania sp. SIO3B5 TaxID=2607811 RepID=UPI0013FFE5AB
MLTKDKVLFNDWHVVALASDCQPGTLKRVRLLEEDLVLWRGDSLQCPIQVWQDRCPHRSARLSLGKVSQNNLLCPYHGWKFNQRGKCEHIPHHPALQPPASACVKTYHCQERWGFVWVCLGEPAQDIPPFPEWDQPSYHKVFFGPYHFRSSGFRVVENAFDVPHFAFVHDGSLGARDNTVIEEYDVTVNTEGVTLSNIHVWQPDTDGIGTIGKVTYLHKICRPLTLYTVKKIAKGQETALYTISPVAEEDSIAWGVAAFNYEPDMLEAEFRAFQDKLYSEDAPMVESQCPARLPLLSGNNPKGAIPFETHVPSDRGSV